MFSFPEKISRFNVFSISSFSHVWLVASSEIVLGGRGIVLNATFNNISVISWRRDIFEYQKQMSHDDNFKEGTFLLARKVFNYLKICLGFYLFN